MRTEEEFGEEYNFKKRFETIHQTLLSCEVPMWTAFLFDKNGVYNDIFTYTAQPDSFQSARIHGGMITYFDYNSEKDPLVEFSEIPHFPRATKVQLNSDLLTQRKQFRLKSRMEEFNSAIFFGIEQNIIQGDTQTHTIDPLDICMSFRKKLHTTDDEIAWKTLMKTYHWPVAYNIKLRNLLSRSLLDASKFIAQTQSAFFEVRKGRLQKGDH
jgi:hypothetical protein